MLRLVTPAVIIEWALSFSVKVLGSKGFVSRLWSD